MEDMMHSRRYCENGKSFKKWEACEKIVYIFYYIYMDITLYFLILMGTTAIEIAILAIVVSFFHFRSEKLREKNHRDLVSFMRYMSIEGRKSSQEIQRRDQENHQEALQISKENSLFLRMIFERIDGNPPQNQG